MSEIEDARAEHAARQHAYEEAAAVAERLRERSHEAKASLERGTERFRSMPPGAAAVKQAKRNQFLAQEALRHAKAATTAADLAETRAIEVQTAAYKVRDIAEANLAVTQQERDNLVAKRDQIIDEHLDELIEGMERTLGEDPPGEAS